MNDYDNIDRYMRGVSVCADGVGADREKELSKIIRHSEDEALKDKAINELVNGNLGLVVKCAREVFNGYHSTLSLMDLITEGNYWLLYSVKHFNYDKDCRLSTYAYPIIRWHLWTIINANTLIHIPLYLFEYKKKFRELKEKYKDELTKEILMKEFEVLGDKAETISDTFELIMSSLDSAIGEDSDDTLKDMVKDEFALDPSIEVDKKMLKEHLDRIGDKCLNEREKEIINLMFYSNMGLNFGELAKKMKITASRASQLYHKAMRKLRNRFFNEWDCDHAEDRIDKEEVYKEATGDVGFCYAHRMRLGYDDGFRKKLNEKLEEKGKKIFKDLV